MREGKTGAPARKILRTQKSAMGWTLLLSNLLLLTLALGGQALYYMQLYAGGWAALGSTTFTAAYLDAITLEPRLRLRFTLEAVGMEARSWDVTTELALTLALFLGFVLVQGLISAISGAIWRGRVRQHLKRLTSLAQEARRLGAEAAAPQQVEHLREAIGHIQPTEPTRLHTADPDLKGLEDAVNDLLDRMQAAYSQQTRFVSDASHELKTPLTSIKGFTDMLASGMVASPEDQKRFITMIGVEVDRLIDLINDILKLSELESVAIDQCEERSDANAVAQSAVELLSPSAKQAEVRLTLSGEEAVVAVPEGRLKELMLNLISNGIKYTEPGGSVTVQVRTQDGRAVLTVADTGIGIPEEAQSRVFERFYRVDKGRARKNGGTGLGLAIVKHIVQLYGGTVRLESEVGKGSTFTVTLPLAEK